jgi:hypothetical protein
MDHMQNYRGVANLIQTYQAQIKPWVDEEPMSLTDMDNCRHCGGQGFKAEMEIARLQSICRKTKCGPLENEIV